MDQKKRRLIQPASILLPVDSTLDFGWKRKKTPSKRKVLTGPYHTGTWNAPQFSGRWSPWNDCAIYGQHAIEQEERRRSMYSPVGTDSVEPAIHCNNSGFRSPVGGPTQGSTGFHVWAYRDSVNYWYTEMLSITDKTTHWTPNTRMNKWPGLLNPFPHNYTQICSAPLALEHAACRLHCI